MTVKNIEKELIVIPPKVETYDRINGIAVQIYAKENFTQKYAANKLNEIMTIFICKGIMAEKPIPPRTKPLAKSKKKFANPFACS